MSTRWFTTLLAVVTVFSSCTSASVGLPGGKVAPADGNGDEPSYRLDMSGGPRPGLPIVSLAQAQKRVSFPVVLPRWKESPKIASVQVTITADKPPNRGLFIRWEDERQLSVGLADPVDFRQFPDSWLGPNAEIVTLHDVDVLLGVHPPGEFMRRDWIQSAGAQWYANGLQWTLVAPLSRDEMVESLEDLIGRAA